MSADADSSESMSIEENRGIVLQELRKEFGDLVAVNDIDLRISEGELLVLLGPSGCGKTTTLRMIAGLELPTDGRIAIQGDEVTQMAPQNRDVSMVFQSYALYPHKTVRGNLEFPLAKMDIDERTKEEKISETVELLEIDGLLDRMPRALSGGQRQRVALGRTIIREPKAFLMDEPLSNLDAKLRVQTRAEIRQLQQLLGVTTVYVTHDQEEAMSIADRIVIMNDGIIEQIGTPEEIYERPNNEFVAGFMGDPPINFLDTRESGSEASIIDDAGVDGLTEDVVRIGVRPEDIYFVDPSTGNPLVEDVDVELSDFVPVTVDVIEPLGNAYEVTLTRGDARVKARVRELPEGVTDGSDVAVGFDSENVHHFAVGGPRIEKRLEE